MRIISGKYKGRQLASATDQSIRPTTGKIKEYMFNLLGDFVVNAEVLDLFSGSGGLGIESLSRGAKSVVFVDKAQSSLRILRRNLNRIKVEEPFNVVRKGTQQFLKQNKTVFDLIFADPPFVWGEFDEMLDLIFTTNALSEFGMVVVESEKKHEVVWETDAREVVRQKIFDRSVITILTRKVPE